ncbi:MAG: HDOD domain-containing protein, partial [Desulfobacterales bacterium]
VTIFRFEPEGFNISHVFKMDQDYPNRERNLKRIQATIARMPSLSTTVVKVLETCNDPRASANDLKRVISLDPVLTGRVLKLINSAYFALGKPVTSLTRAIIMLGVNTVKNLALSFAILKNMQGSGSFHAFSTNDFWLHCLGVGVVAKALAATKGLYPAEQEEYFVAGLLHDLGKLPLNKQFPEEYFQVSKSAGKENEPFYLSEQRLLGIEHCQVGELIAKKWRLGVALIETLAHHHDPEACSEHNRDLVTTVAVANQITMELKIGDAGDCVNDRAMPVSLPDTIGVERADLSEFNEAITGEIDKARIFLEIVQK